MQRYYEAQYHHQPRRSGQGMDNLVISRASHMRSGSGSQGFRGGVEASTVTTPYRAMPRSNPPFNGISYISNHSNTYQLLAKMKTASSDDSIDFQPYLLDRGNGQFTRLIPADTLPPLNEIPAREDSAVGKVVLQPISPRERRVTLKAAPRERDNVQNCIDTIVSKTPPKQKREKIYCDKWVHEGVCAFAQQGCRYKHEMPLDKETQHQLGLYQGLPAWWRKQQADAGAQCEAINPDSVAGPLTPSTGSPPDSASFIPVGRRTTMTMRGRSPAKRFGQGVIMHTTPRGIVNGSARGAFADVKVIRRVDDTRRWSNEPGPTVPFQEQCVWGPIEPPSSTKMDDSREFEVKSRQQYTYGGYEDDF